MTRGRFRAVLVACVALAATACGGGDNDAPGSGAEPPADAPRTLISGSITLPDLSPLPASLADRVRAHYAELQRAEAENMPDVEIGNAAGRLGVLMGALGSLDTAVRSLESAVALAPNDPRWPYSLGHIQMQAQNPAAAAVAFERTLTLRPSDVAALIWLGRARLDEGQPQEAGPLFEQAIAIDADSAAALAGAAQVALGEEDFARAAGYLERALEIAPEASGLRYPLALAYRGLGRVAEANEQLLQQGSEGPPIRDPLMEELDEFLDLPMDFEQQGIIALRNSDWAAAAAAFREGLALDPDNPALRTRLATALSMLGDNATAVAELERAVATAPDFPQAHFGLATTLALEGRTEEAIDRFRTVLRLQPDHVGAHMGLAEALHEQQRFEEALAHYGAAVETDPTIVQAWIGRADTLMRLARLDEARAWLAEAQQAHPDNPILRGMAEGIATVGR